MYVEIYICVVCKIKKEKQAFEYSQIFSSFAMLARASV